MWSKDGATADGIGGDDAGGLSSDKRMVGSSTCAQVCPADHLRHALQRY